MHEVKQHNSYIAIILPSAIKMDAFDKKSAVHFFLKNMVVQKWIVKY